MYIPSAFREEDFDKLVAFMRSHSFATLVSIMDGVPFASHIPLVAVQQENTLKLVGHLAKANPHWKAFETGESLAIFTGAHAYISPTHYEKTENVPTWNYIAVHAYGTPRPITLSESHAEMHGMIDSMIENYEPTFKHQWDGLSDGYRDGMMNAIVGFEMTVTRLEGKYKLSQNRSPADQHNVAHALMQDSDPVASSVGELMQQNLQNKE